MRVHRKLVGGLLAVLMAVIWPSEARADDETVTITIKVKDRKITEITVDKPKVEIEGASKKDKADGETVTWVVKLETDPPGVAFTGKVTIEFDKTPFKGFSKLEIRLLGGSAGGQNATETRGTFPYKIKILPEGEDEPIIRDGEIELLDLRPPRCSPPVLLSCGFLPCVIIDVQDEQSGLQTITDLSYNVDLSGHEGFPTGTNDIVTVLGTKHTPGVSSRMKIQPFDVAGNYTFCDPVLTQVLRSQGKPLRETHLGIPREEHVVTIRNGHPGLSHLEILVNGRSYRLHGMQAGEERTLDVVDAMIPGDKNIFVLKATGKPGGSAVVMIWNGQQ